MGFNFSFFGTNEHRVFNYRPRYFDEEKEERRKKFGDVDDSAKEEKYVPGSYIKGSFRNGNYQKQRGESKAQKYMGMVALLLALVVVYLVVKMWPLMMTALGIN